MTSEASSIDLDLSDVTDGELVSYVGVASAIATQALTPATGVFFLALSRALVKEHLRRSAGEPPGSVRIEVSPDVADFAAQLQQGLGLTMLLREHSCLPSDGF